MSLGGKVDDGGSGTIRDQALKVATTGANAGSAVAKSATTFTDKFFNDYIKPSLAKLDTATQTAATQNTAIYNTQSQQAADREATYQGAKPAINRYLTNAANINAPGYEEQQAGLAIGDVANQQANAVGQTDRALQARGINAGSAAAVAARTGVDQNAALVKAAQSTRARQLATEYKLNTSQNAAGFAAGLAKDAPGITQGQLATVGQGAAIPGAQLSAQSDAGKGHLAGYQVASNAYNGAASGAWGAATNSAATVAKAQSDSDAGVGKLVGTVVGGIGGAIVGGPAGALAGAQIGSSISDRRLKKDITYLRTNAKGYKIYSYHYLWGGRLQTGVMADEAKLINPACVKKLMGSYEVVDYSRVGEL